MKKILVVDDDTDILEALHLILESEGYEVQTATSEKETLEELSDFKPDLVLLDVLLSGEDGRVICRKIKSNQALPKTCVVMMSAHLTAQESSLGMGADGFLAKPFDIHDLLGLAESLTAEN